MSLVGIRSQWTRRQCSRDARPPDEGNGHGSYLHSPISVMVLMGGVESLVESDPGGFEMTVPKASLALIPEPHTAIADGTRNDSGPANRNCIEFKSLCWRRGSRVRQLTASPADLPSVLQRVVEQLYIQPSFLPRRVATKL